MRSLIIFVALLCIQAVAQSNLPLLGAGAGTAAAAPTFLGPVDAYIDMNTSSPGTQITTTIMGNGTLGLGNTAGWSASASPPTGMTVASHRSSCTLLGTPQVNGTIYPTNHTSQAVAYDNANNVTYVRISVLPDSTQMTISGCFSPGAASVAQGSAQLFDMVGFTGATGSGGAMQLNNGNCGGAAVYGMNLETVGVGAGHSTCIPVVSGNFYWFSMTQDQVAGTGSLSLWDLPSGNFLATVTHAIDPVDATLGGWNYITIGNGETGQSAGHTSYFENVMFQLTGGAPYPIGPSNTTQNSTVYKVNQARNTTANAGSASTTAAPAFDLKAGNLSLVFWSAENAAATVSSITDTAGNTYTSDSTCKITNAGNGRGEVWWAKNATANASDVVTVNHTASTFRNVVVVQVAGANTSTPFDVCATAQVATNNMTSASFTPSTSSGTNFAFGYITSGIVMRAGTNYRQIFSDTTTSTDAMERVNAPTSSQTAGFTSANASPKWMVVINLKP